jgi:hypothetical protein
MIKNWTPTYNTTGPCAAKNCAFVLGGPSHGRILQYEGHVPPLYWATTKPTLLRAFEEPDLESTTSRVDYHLECLRLNGVVEYIYIPDGETIHDCLLKGLCDLHFFLKELRGLPR